MLLLVEPVGLELVIVVILVEEMAHYGAVLIGQGAYVINAEAGIFRISAVTILVPLLLPAHLLPLPVSRLLVLLPPMMAVCPVGMIGLTIITVMALPH